MMVEGKIFFRQMILKAFSGCNFRHRAVLHSHAVLFFSNDADTGNILEFLFGRQAEVNDVAGEKPLPEGMWRIGIIVSDEICDLLKDRKEIPADGDFAFLKTYWRPDFPSAFLALTPDVTVVRHSDPFVGLTILLNKERLLLYVRPSREKAFIPHIETLTGYLWRCDSWEEGFLDLHAAMVRYRGCGIAIIGPKMAGKTSLAMHFLARGGDLLGSDFGQVKLLPDRRLEARAVPHICRITPETIADNAYLDRVISGEYRTDFAYRQGPVFSHGKAEFFAPGLDEIFKRPVNITSMNVDLLLFPRFSKQTTQQRISPMDADHARQRLAQSIGFDRPLADWLPFSAVMTRLRRETPLIEALADARVEAYAVEFGRELSLDWTEIDAVAAGIGT